MSGACDGAELDVRRVAWGFWTWTLRLGDSVVMGKGCRAEADAAVTRFLNKHGAKEITEL